MGAEAGLEVKGLHMGLGRAGLPNIGDLIIRIGFGGPLYYIYIYITRSPQNSIGALIITIRFWDPLYYIYDGEPPKQHRQL